MFANNAFYKVYGQNFKFYLIRIQTTLQTNSNKFKQIQIQTLQTNSNNTSNKFKQHVKQIQTKRQTNSNNIVLKQTHFFYKTIYKYLKLIKNELFAFLLLDD